MNNSSGEESERRWKILKDRASSLKSAAWKGAPKQSDDPFDCSNLVVPTSQALVDNAINTSIQQWKELEERRVVAVDEVVGKESLSGKKRTRPGERTNWGRHAHRLRIPEFFDYTTREPNPPSDDDTGERVVSLEDTSVHLSFEQELWKIFKQVPTVQELEANALEGAECQHMRVLHVEMTEGVREHSRMDCHALCRLRMADRHGLPCTKNGHTATTIRLECLRRQIKRGSSPDGHRLELEFLGSQSLKDVHDVIVELSKDELWDDAKQPANANEDVSGMFFIEDTFYTAGPVDYSAPILTWLDGATPCPPRRAFLGLPANETLKVKPMSSVTLEQLQWRMGVRYFHSHHGDVECSVFLTDIRHGQVSPKAIYPIIHDVWSPSYSMAECEGCRNRVGVLCTASSNEMTDGGPRALCETCYKQLHPSGEAETCAKALKFSVWREQVDLSLGHQDPRVIFQDMR